MNEPMIDFEKYDRMESEYRKSRPVCYYCEEPIFEDYAYECNNHKYCEECFKDNIFDLVGFEFITYIGD